MLNGFRSRSGLALVGLALVVGLACSEPSVPVSGDDGSELETIRLHWRVTLAHAPLAIAMAEGFFADEGLDVQTITMLGRESILALSQGELDVAAPWLSIGLFNAIRVGERIRLVADKSHLDDHCSAYSVLARSDLIEDGTLDDPANMKGMTIDYWEGSIMAYAVETMLADAGLTHDDIYRINVTGITAVDAFSNASIDLNVESEPATTFVIESGAAKQWKAVNEILPNQQMSAVLFGSRLLDERPDLGEKFMTAYLRGVRQYREGKTDRNVEIIAEFTNLDADVIRRTCWTPIDPEGAMHFDSIDKLLSWAVSAGYIEDVVSRDEYWDGRFVDYANAELERRGNTE